jgi:hypothetical protein
MGSGIVQCTLAGESGLTKAGVGVLAARWSEIASDRSELRSRILVEHDLFGKPASIAGSSPATGFFRIML